MKGILVLWMVLIAGSLSNKLLSQRDYLIQFKDSLRADDSTEWLSNDIRLYNPTKSDVSISIKVILPPKWKLVEDLNDTVKLKPGESRIIPVNIIKEPQALAQWQSATINVHRIPLEIPDQYVFYLICLPNRKFSLSATLREVLIRKNSRRVSLEAILKNTGNISDKYVVETRQGNINLDKISKYALEPGETVVHTEKIKLSKLTFKSFTKERVTQKAISNGGKIVIENYEIIKLDWRNKKHPSAFSRFNLQPEVGGFYVGDKLSYFIGARGTNKLRNGGSINYSYRSKQLGIGNTTDLNVFEIEYSTKKWRFYLGQQSEINSFYSFGQGFSITRFAKRNTEINISSIFHFRNSPYKSDIYAAGVKHRVGKNTFRHNLSTNFVHSEKRFAIAFTNDLELFSGKYFNLNVQLNAGQDHFMRKFEGLPADKAGTALGYSTGFHKGKWGISSSYLHGTLRYPGVLKGLTNQNHVFSFRSKHIQLGLFYQYNRTLTENIIFRDTVYNTDFFNYNLERFGASMGWNFGQYLNMILSAGKQRQTDISSYSDLGNFKFFEFESNFRKGKNFGFRISSNAAFNPAYGVLKEKTWINRTNISIEHKLCGVRAFYVRSPKRYFISGTDTSYSLQETMNISPYLRFTLFRQLNLSFNYNFSKSLFDTSLATYAGIGIYYNNQRNGIRLQVSGNLPVSNTSWNFNNLANNSINFSLSKNMNLPFISKRRYHNLNIFLFIDSNKNMKMDSGELPMKEMTVGVDNILFLTDNKGRIKYQNLDKGYYVINLETVAAPRGLIPFGGLIQFQNVQENAEVIIAYQKGNVISGRIWFVIDSMAIADESAFSLSNIKVSAVDSLKNYYKAFTNSKGEYFINLPAGTYTVSLNREAFTGEYKPSYFEQVITVNETVSEAEVNFEITKMRKIRLFNQKE